MKDQFFFQAFVYLLAAVVSVPIAKRLGMGSVLGYLAAGVVIGPNLLGWIGQEGHDVMKFAEFGVVMMLFLIGLELKPSLLWKLRLPILGMGGAQVAGTAFLLGEAALVFGLSWKMALATGFILAMSSTAIALQTLQEKGLVKTPGGEASFSVLLFQDISVIPILAILPLLATGQVNASSHSSHGIASLPAWAQVLAVLGAVTAIVGAGRFLLRPLFRVIASTGLRELFTATALLLIVGIALLMEFVGMSPALGAFLAGVVLAENEYRHELEGDIEPFKGLLLGLFFISVGASIDFHFILRHPFLVALGVLGVMSVKFGFLFGLGRVFGVRGNAALLFAVALSQVGEFAFVLLSLSEQQGVLTSHETKPLVAIVALSMALTPPLFLIYDRFLSAKLSGKKGEEKEADAIENDEAPVIIAGFGRMGNLIGRLLRANGISTTVLDLNPDEVDRVRKVGLKAHYGDASRLDLLRAAGAEKARLLILAIDAPDKAVEIAEIVRRHFPKIQILARARDRFDAYAFFKLGIDGVFRETFGTAIDMGYEALKRLGFRSNRARRAALLYKKHNEDMLRELAAHWGADKKNYFQILRYKISQEEGMLRDKTADAEVDRAWDNTTLREESARRFKGPKL